MIEVELKFPVHDLEAFRQRLQPLQPRDLGQEEQCDLYFQAPGRDLAATDEALRLRRSGNGNWITYKGPKQDPLTKTRLEREARLPDGPLAAELAVALMQAAGYWLVAEVRKQRHRFAVVSGGFSTQIALDQVEGLGSFVELEIAVEADRVEQARQAVRDLAWHLGLHASERRSYLELLLQRERA
jgi:adenylate cyclase class 2